MIELADQEGNIISEDMIDSLEEEPMEVAHIQYLLRMGEVGKELSIVTFEFTSPMDDDDCGCGCGCDSCDEGECHGKCCEEGECHGKCCEEGECHGKCCEGEEDDEDEDEDEDDEDEVMDNIIKLEFDLDVLDQFVKDCKMTISTEDLLLYLISMEFISFLFVFIICFSNFLLGRRMGNCRSFSRVYLFFQ